MTRQQRLVLIVSILASSIAFLDGSIVNVALPAIGRELGGGLTLQQWVVDGYLISLGALILLAGSLSDLFGRKRILYVGLIGFGVTSLLCALSPTGFLLILARVFQGVAGALLVPSSLALIISHFGREAQGKAIGQWTAWTGIAFVIGPLLGGFLVDSITWRLIFAINIIPIVVTLWFLKSLAGPDESKRAKVDVAGAVLCSTGLAAIVFALIEQPNYGWNPMILMIVAVGALLLLAFLFKESRNSAAMLDLSLFRVRNFSFGNIATIFVYGGLSIATFIIVIFLQQVSGYSALEAGMALLPITIVMFLLSPRFGVLSGKFGPRIFMTVGPIVASLGFAAMLSVPAHVSYFTQLLPGVMIFALGLSVTVAPLTSAVLSDVNKRQAGVASAVNNAIARIAGLITVALIGVLVGTRLDLGGFRSTIAFAAILVFMGGVVSFIGIRNHGPELELQKQPDSK